MSAVPPLRPRAFLTVFLKEVKENLRDRRTILSAFLTGPLLGPIMMVMLLNVTLNRELDKSEKTLPVPVVGAEYAPNLIADLKANDIKPLPPIANPELAVRKREADVVLRISPDYPGAWRKGEQVQVEMIYDSSKREASAAVERVSDQIETYARQQGAMRLVARGLSAGTAWPVRAARRDQATAQSRASMAFGVLPYFFVITVLVGGMYLAIDLTAGERERQSLEPLFANPVPRWKILAGKLAAICTFSAISLGISLLAFGVAGRLLPTEQFGMELDLGPRFAGHVLLMMAPLILLTASLQSMVAAFAKSYREAQTYMQLLMLVPMIPSMLLTVLPIKAQDWMFAVPLLGQHIGITQLLSGEGVGGMQLLLCLAGSLAAAVIAVLVTVRLYSSERLAISG